MTRGPRPIGRESSPPKSKVAMVHLIYFMVVSAPVLCYKNWKMGMFKALFNSLREPAFVIDGGRTVLDANPSFSVWLGLDISAVKGMPCYKALGLEGHCALCPLKEAAGKKSGSTTLEIRGRAYQTEIIDIGGGKAVEVIRGDNSEGGRASNSEGGRASSSGGGRASLWEETFDSIAVPMFIHDAQYRVLKANSTYLKISGLTAGEVIGKPYYAAFPKADEPLPSCRKAVAGDAGRHIEEKITAPDGRVFLSEAFPLRMDGEPENFVHVLTDITGLVRVQEKMEEEAGISASLLEFITAVSKLLDIKTILDEALRAATALTAAQRAVAFMRHPEDGEFRAVSLYGWPEYLLPAINSLRLGREEMPASTSVFKGEDILIPDAKASNLIDRAFMETLGLRAVLISPVITSEGVSGVVMVEKDGQFSGKDMKILRGITSNMAVAVENARLYKEFMEMSADLARRMETIRATYEIDRTILSTLSQKDILEVVTRNTQRVIPAEKIITVQLDDEGTNYLHNTEEIPVGNAPFLDSIFRTGRVASIPELNLYRHPEPLISDLMREGFSSLIAMPLNAKGRTTGCIIMAGKRVGAFDKDDIANGERLAAQMAVALENARLYEDLKGLFISTVSVLVNVIDAKSQWTKGHSERVTEYALEIGREMGLAEDELERLRLAGILHDIGKVGTYDIVLDKPGKLTDEEMRLVKRHPLKGAKILQPIKLLKDIIPAVRGHHERFDGGGYPDGLSGHDISLFARILSVGDSFDSMTADRPYRPSPGMDYAVEELKRCSGTQFDPAIVEAFLKAIHRQGAASPGV